ncbi:MAG: Riboflavin biosynthesis protein [Verrucomicrobiaceae bacterium]|nr:Riboflavin biosynthesis protein [Verrucomicrobiaceae bacterium]
MLTVLHDIAELTALERPVVLAIGVFDGVHRGHQLVIQQAQARARERGAVMVLMTFDPHPMRVLRPGTAPKLLCTAEHQQLILARQGVTHLLLCEFNETVAKTSAEDFVRSLAAACRKLDAVFVGETWRFGAKRAGDIDLLKRLGVELAFEAFGVKPLAVDDKVISSTLIRQAVERGDFVAAKELLGRDYTVLGTVIEGRKLARQLGFPTANLDVHNEQLPPAGVYAVRALIGETWYPGVANLGRRPTVADTDDLSLEVHVFDFDADLYGQLVEVTFVQHLRNEKKFAGLDELKAQIGEDAVKARLALSYSAT